MSADEQEDSMQTTPHQEADELAGITRLLDEFYVNMDTLPEAETIRSMHPEDLTESRKKLTYFLSGWLGAPSYFCNTMGQSAFRGSTNSFPSSTKNAMPGCSACNEPSPFSRTVTNSKLTS
jgi:hemoglobin